MNPPLEAAEPSNDRLLRLVERTSSAGRALRRLLADQAAAVQLSDAELLVVWLCSESACHGMVQGDLAVAIGVSPALMSGLVQRLLERGLIEMQRSTVDRRRQVWRTTAGGRALLAALRPVLGSLAQQLDRQVSASDQLAVQGLCERLSAAAAELASVVPLARIAPLPAKQGAAA
jgi:MarR family transcriptional regulator, 2-MHQ and catechol-resistance regulon repressor